MDEELLVLEGMLDHALHCPLVQCIQCNVQGVPEACLEHQGWVLATHAVHVQTGELAVHVPPGRDHEVVVPLVVINFVLQPVQGTSQAAPLQQVDVVHIVEPGPQVRLQ